MISPSDETQVLTYVKSLEDYHGKGLTREARVYYVQALAPYSPAMLADAVQRWKDQNSPATRFPSLNQIRACVDEQRAHTWARTKTTENRQPISDPTVSTDPAYQRACWDLIRRASRMTKAELADAFEAHHRQWPGHGWNDAANRLRARLPKTTRSAA